ncbi:unnamed protein product [Microthlaspi erraticum]|uniref:Arabidopsis retrotransposon Orf1 C-terminal domain-containing protein n=1 Tax=Microthlaspi erraticum TaxID=1685480 RepID=A0A6D2K0D7_9BRAS|nr:unnamed protein product [Microthlaspi erraticum]
MHLAKFFSHRMESYKELTCEFFGIMREKENGDHLQAAGDLFGFTYGEGTHWGYQGNELQRFGLQSLRRILFFKIQGCSDRSPVLRYVHKALANTFFARKATGTINEGEVKLLDMGIKPIISRTRMGRGSEGDRYTGNLCLFQITLLQDNSL